jgi:hypothetical protein
LAQCIALSSQNTATPSTLAVNNDTSQDILLTHNGELTFATLDPSPYIAVTMMFNSPSSPQPIVIEYLNLTTAPSSLSPWFGVDYTTINGRKYYVRSLNVLATQPAPLVFQVGLIATGSTVYFPNSTAVGQLLILLAAGPQTVADRTYDKYIDTATAKTSTPQLYYSAGNVYAGKTIIKNTYPPIIAA